MNRIDYELGLATYEDEDFSGADGKAKALTCRTFCNVKHPFNKGKRNSCKEGCNAKYLTSEETWEEPPAAPPPPPKTPIDGTDTTETAGMSTGAKIGIGVGAVVILGLVIYLIAKKK
jgi:hypothetical protein|tara:strand:+ start:157 stop:507 length:351 start_codon:yes stop_codon:yes gene_type:complete